MSRARQVRCTREPGNLRVRACALAGAAGPRAGLAERERGGGGTGAVAAWCPRPRCAAPLLPSRPLSPPEPTWIQLGNKLCISFRSWPGRQRGGKTACRAAAAGHSSQAGAAQLTSWSCNKFAGRLGAIHAGSRARPCAPTNESLMDVLTGDRLLAAVLPRGPRSAAVWVGVADSADAHFQYVMAKGKW